MDDLRFVYEEEKESLSTYLKQLPCRICLSIYVEFDSFWFVVRFIDDDWNMKEIIIAIRKIERNPDVFKGCAFGMANP